MIVIILLKYDRCCLPLLETENEEDEEEEEDEGDGEEGVLFADGVLIGTTVAPHPEQNRAFPVREAPHL